VESDDEFIMIVPSNTSINYCVLVDSSGTRPLWSWRWVRENESISSSANLMPFETPLRSADRFVGSPPIDPHDNLA
jgi:hypothetical protein